MVCVCNEIYVHEMPVGSVFVQIDPCEGPKLMKYVVLYFFFMKICGNILYC